MRSLLLLRNSLWSALDLSLGLLSGIVLSVLVARALGPSRLGSYALVMWLVGVAGSMGAHGIGRATAKFAAELLGRGERAQAKALVASGIRGQLGLAILIAIICLGVVFTLVDPSDRAWAVIAVVSLLPAMLLSSAARGIEVTQDFRLNVLPSIAGNAVHIVLSGLTLLRGWGLVGLTTALLTSRVLDCVMRFRFLRGAWADVPSAPVPVELRPRILRIAVLATIQIFLDMVVWDRSEVFFLRRFSDVREIAYYSLSFGIMKQVLILPQTFSWASGTNLLVEYGRAPSTVGALAGRMTALLAVPAFPLAAGMGVMSGLVLPLLYGTQYLPAIPVLSLVALFATLSALQIPAYQLLVAAERQGTLLAWGAAAAALNVSLDLALIPRAGAVGAAIANGVSQTAAVISLWLLLRRIRLGFVLPIATITKVGISTAVMALAAFVVSRALPPVPGLVAGVAVGAVVYVVMLRLVRCLPAAEREGLAQMGAFVPQGLRPVYRRLVEFVVP